MRNNGGGYEPPKHACSMHVCEPIDAQGCVLKARLTDFFLLPKFEAASDDVVSLVRWTLESLQSYFTKIKGRWIPRPVAEIATQDCQNFCVPCTHEGS